MQSFGRLFGVLILAVVLTHCASMKKRGAEALQAGEYDKAAEYFEKAVNEDSQDIEAAAGLRQARAQVLSQKLITVRNARLASNLDAAVEQLAWIVKKEREWGIQPGGKASFTQEEEVELLTRFFISRVDAEIKAEFPLRSQRLLKLLGGVFPPKTTTPLRARVLNAGKASCAKMKAELADEQPWFAQFVSEYCGYWGESVKLSTATRTALNGELYGSLQLSNRPDGLSPEVYAGLTQKLQKAFHALPWFEAGGAKSAQGSFKGNLSVERSKSGVVLVKNYFEPEQYVEQVMVTKTRTVSYTESVSQYDSTTKSFQWQQVPRTRQETYTETEPQQKTRQVERAYRYPAWKHAQNIALFVDADFKIGGQLFNVAVSDKDASEGIEHDENQPKYGLQAQSPHLPEPNQWSSEKLKALVDGFTKRGSELWDEAYCSAGGLGGSLAQAGNRAQLCLRAHSGESAPEAVQEWYKTTLGLNVRDAQALLRSALE